MSQNKYANKLKKKMLSQQAHSTQFLICYTTLSSTCLIYIINNFCLTPNGLKILQSNQSVDIVGEGCSKQFLVQYFSFPRKKIWKGKILFTCQF